MTENRWHGRAAIAAAFTLLLATAAVAAPLGPAQDVSGPGLTATAGGTGTGGDHNPRMLPVNVDVNIGGDVQAAFLYWGGFMSSLATPGDANLRLDGNPVSGALTGIEVINDNGFMTQAWGRSVDVTGIVQAAYSGPGLYSFTVDDDGSAANDSDRLHGVSLLVIYTDPADSRSYRIVGFHGADYAFDSTRFLNPDNRVTAPIVYNYAATSSVRSADLWIFGFGGEANRNERIDITANASIFDSFDSSQGNQWETDLFSVIIPVGATSTTVQAFSAGANKDSLAVEFAALRIPLAAPAIDIRKQQEGDDSRAFPLGADVPFDIVVTNTGDVDLTDVEVTDDLLPGCAQFIGDLAVGASFSYTCTDFDLTAGYTNIACVEGRSGDDVLTDCDPSTVEVEVPGGDGCTPGYWRQPQHFWAWTGYSQGDSYSTVFGVSPSFGDLTLLQAVWQGGGGENALGRHAVAALLNSTHPEVDYAFDTASVIAIVQGAYASGDFETAKNMLEYENELGCPIDNRSGVISERLGRGIDRNRGTRLPTSSQPNTAVDMQRN